MLEPKLERYLKNCYPPGNGSEKHAKPSELSYLMYYLQSHRYRIAHAAKLLQSRLQRQLPRQNKLGNAVVTLEIARELTIRCKDDINVFAETILEMAERALPNREPVVAVAAARVFEEFVRVSDGLLFINKEDADLFLRVVDIIQYTATKQSGDTQSQREAALQAIDTFTQSPCITTDIGLVGLDHAVPALYAQTMSQHDTSCFKTLFGSSQLVVMQTLQSILKCALNDPKLNQKEMIELMSDATRWVQVQLRFVVPKVVLSQMIEHPKSLDILADYLLVILRSPVSMIGLDVRYTLSQLLDLQHEYPNKKLRECISALAAHTVYPGQGNDMLHDILTRYAAMSQSSTQIKEETVVGDFENVGAILESSNIDRLLLDPWTSTQWLLSLGDRIVVAYTRAFSSYVAAANTENTKAASQLVRQLSQLFLQSNPYATYIAAYYCLERLILSLGNQALLLTPTIGQLQDAGFKNATIALKQWEVAATISASQALLLAIAHASGRSKAENSYFKVIDERVKTGSWLNGIIFVSSTVDIADAVAATRQHPPQVHQLAPHLVLDLDELDMTEQELALAAALDVPINETVPLGSLNNFKTRARSLADSVTTSGDQRILSGRIPTGAQIDAPTVSQLRRRATSAQTYSSNGSGQSAAVSTFKPSNQLMGMIKTLSIEGGNRGNLVV